MAHKVSRDKAACSGLVEITLFKVADNQSFRNGCTWAIHALLAGREAAVRCPSNLK